MNNFILKLILIFLIFSLDHVKSLFSNNPGQTLVNSLNHQNALTTQTSNKLNTNKNDFLEF